ncbi:acyl-[acyl-carrier-protein] thioesterase [Mycolicibacterium pyrenivorans]|uniref:acyl-[acyl-carrier-protein] thioesterase n=1 Tax=Mycolicibacterium pyrenivorans TaxID=187102 RepID=UPI0021F34829|nr:acyl-[acyl-carrier-protein] thioesterase [Mycolicibacterium pyrenivorans]MCV7149811.1 acyl-[acyl-carrier-protein] thioesterase [Mycolicibacterium pyrenivorans]
MPTNDVDRRLSDMPATGYVYRTSWPVATGDLDGNLHLRLDGVARYIQEVGAENLVDAGEAEDHPHWLVQRTVIDIIEPIEFPNDVSFSRWCSALSSRWCTMRVDLVGSDGGRIETEGFWIAINSKTLTPQRVSDTLIERFASTTDVRRLKWRPWLENPDNADEEMPFPLRRTDIDIFEHVTNTAYWHAIHEVMALVPDVCRAPYRAVIEYRRPIKYGEEVTIQWIRHGDGDVPDVQIALAVGDDVRAAALLRKL